jgi:CheY-like chemotaxis protein
LISFLDQNRAQATSSKYILILDLKMSMVNGFDVLTWLRRQPEYAATRVAVVTASPLESDRARAEASGANAYYEKFPEPEDLRQFLSRETTGM